VLTEDWCEAALVSLPVLACLAETTGKLNVHIFMRDERPELMDRFLRDGRHRTIPAFVFLTAEFDELGRWYERPAVINTMQEKMLAELYERDPAFRGITPGTPFPQLPEPARLSLIEALKKFRRETRVVSDHEIVREIQVMLAERLAEAGPSR
jgi:hypothetical protein